MTSHLSNVWFSVTPLQVATGTRVLGHHHRRRGVPRLRRRHRRQLHRPRPPAGRRGDRRAGRSGSSTRRSTSTSTICSSRWPPSSAELTPGAIDTFFFANSGAEITEAAIKLAKQVTKRPQHHRVQRQLPRPHAPGDGDDDVEDRLSRRSLAVARRACSSPRSPTRWPPIRTPRSPSALARLRPPAEDDDRAGRDRRASSSSRCSARVATSRRPPRSSTGSSSAAAQHGILFIADEVQSGFGRTGKMFAVEHYGIEPDIICMAKGIASGFPVRRARHAPRARRPAGRPAATAAPTAATRWVARRRWRRSRSCSEPGFLENVVARGDQLQRRHLAELQREHDVDRPGARARA